MILPFELAKISFLVESTNCCLEIKIDSSIYEKYREYLMREINFLEMNKFDNDSFEPIYEEFNNIINQCIEAIKNKLELLKCGKTSDKVIDFNVEKYKKCLY